MPVAMTRSDGTYYLAYNQVGSLRIVADASGNVVKGIEYDSFGNIIIDTAPAFEVPFGFAGGLHDRDTGLVRFGYRDFDPDVGRWTAKDPIGFAGGDTDLYGYCLNDPVNFIDADGLFLKYVGSVAVAVGKWGLDKLKKWAAKKIKRLPGEQAGKKVEKDVSERYDGDGVTNDSPEQIEMDRDTDGDGENDFYDNDDDNDGIPDDIDEDPKDPVSNNACK
jgi:RHS repeat-associated protein